MHPWAGNWVAIRRAVMYYVWAAQALSAGIKYRHCSNMPKRELLLMMLEECLANINNKTTQFEKI